MPRYPKQDNPKGKKVIPSVTEIIDDCTSDKHWSIPYGVNQACGWIADNRRYYELIKQDKSTIYYKLSDDDLRYKRKDEKEYPNNARYAHKHYSQKALDIGSDVHKLIEQYLKGNEADLLLVNEEVYNAFEAFLKWKDEHNLKPIALEQTVYGDGWAGTLDFLGYFNDKLYVIDWKSSKAHYPEMRYQIAAYRSALGIQVFGENNDHPQGCGILRLDKETGLPDWKDTSNSYESDLSIFNAMVDLYMLRHPKIAKKARG